MSETNRKIHPLIAIAAAAVIVFSAVGVGVMTGVISSSKSSNEGLSTAETTIKPESKTLPAPAHKPTSPTAQKVPSAVQPKKPEQVAVNQPVPVPPPRICMECGVIDTINVIDKQGSGTGLGAVGGAVAGGLLGNQVGSGRGNTAATVIGAVGGAVAGNEVEKRVKATKEYQVTVRMDDGSTRNFTLDSAPSYVVGEKVKVIDGKVVKG